MRFYTLLIAVNVACFVLRYSLNFREAPNPFAFLLSNEQSKGRGLVKRLFARPGYTDPWRINFDYTFLILFAVGSGSVSGPWRWISAAILAFGFVEITYTTVMQMIFNRPPALVSDISLARAGLSLAQGHRYWIIGLTTVVLALICLAAYLATEWLFRLRPAPGAAPLLFAAFLVPPAIFHWRKYGYTYFLSRTIYSPALHFYRNLAHCWRLRYVARKNRSYFEARNRFSEVDLVRRPNIVIVCVESYGSLIYREPARDDGFVEQLAAYESELSARGYGIASTFSEAPIFAGGSWLSYTSFTYGFRLADGQLFDALFARDSQFGAYESLFHFLKRNGYANVLICPLGGVDTRSVDWDSIDRCFRTDRAIDFDALDFRGPLVEYFGVIRRYSPPDQYSLNFGYEAAHSPGSGPFCLFFCTLNSHYPWASPITIAENWQSLNDPEARLDTSTSADMMTRYREAIRYQLDNVLNFALKRADDDTLLVIFGDHQPPLLTKEHMGPHTPVHVIARNQTFLDAFRDRGFARSLDLTRADPTPIRHEAFLSLFIKGLNAAYGRHPRAEIAFEPDGIVMFEEIA